MSKLTKREIVLSAIILIIIFIFTVSNFKLKTHQKPYNEGELFQSDEIQESEIITSNEQNYKVENELYKNSEIMVDICGAVKNPGVVTLVEGDRIIDAVNKAGGLTDKADRKRINLAKKIYDGEKIIIPEIGEKIQVVEQSEGKNKDDRINLNTATKSELKSLNGIGDVLAERIIEYRNKNGMFENIEDIKKVTGIGQKKFDGFKNYIKVE